MVIYYCCCKSHHTNEIEAANDIIIDFLNKSECLDVTIF